MLRWLWLDHVPSGLELTADERRHVLYHARRRRKEGPMICRSDWFARIAFTAAMIVLATSLIIWVLYLPRMGFSVAGMVISNVMSILLFNGLIWVCIAWFVYRTNGPYVRWAMWEIGKPVCTNCGYILTGAHDPLEPCPECGVRHDVAERKLANSND